MNVSNLYDKKRNLALDADRSISNVRKENNSIKRYYINTYVKKNDYVLDVSCGRGGDLDKYEYRKIKYYKGIDISHQSILDAEVRYNTGFSWGTKPYTFQAEFMTYDLTKPLQLSDMKYDVCSSMFAIHYAFKDEESLDNYVHTMTSSKADTIIVITTCQDRIRRYLLQHVKNPILHITDVSSNIESAFGREIRFNIGKKQSLAEGSRNNLEGTKWSAEDSQEYLVSSEILIDKFDEYDYALCEYTNLEDRITGKVNKNEREVISMYDAYVFIKRC